MKFYFLTVFPLVSFVAFSANADSGIAAKARAIMAENCFDCHGPDKEQRKAKLRLDVREGAIKDLGGYQSVMPGKPDQSELIARLITKDEDELMEQAIDAGADDMQTVEDHYEITTAVENFEAVRKALEDASVPMETAELTRIPQNTVSLDEKKGKALLKLMDILDDHDDIQKAYSNFDISDEVMNAIIENS